MYLYQDLLKIHKNSHTENKLYYCTVCKISFTMESSLKNHMKKDICGFGPVKCKLCSKGKNRYFCINEWSKPFIKGRVQQFNFGFFFSTQSICRHQGSISLFGTDLVLGLLTKVIDKSRSENVS